MASNYYVLFGIFLVSMLFVPALVPTTEAQDVEIPDWTKNIFLWYGEDKVSNDELINALKFLIEEKILSVPASPPSVIKDTTPSNPLYKTYTNEKHDFTFQYPVDWSLAEKYDIQPEQTFGGKGVLLAHFWHDGGWAKSSNTMVGPIAMWITLWYDFSEERAETFFGSSGAAVKVGWKIWCNSKTFHDDGWICSDMKTDVTETSKHGHHQYHILSSHTADQGGGETKRINLKIYVTNIDSSWEIMTNTLAEDWEIYKDEIYSIIDSIQTTHVHTNSNDNGFLRLENSVYELPMAQSVIKDPFKSYVNLYGEFSEEAVGNSLSLEVKKPDGTTDKETFQFKSKESKKIFTYQYVINALFPLGEYEITINSIPNNIRLPPISFTVIPADPENQICSNYGDRPDSENIGLKKSHYPPSGFCRTIDPPVLEKQVQPKEIPAWSKNIFLWYGQGQVSEDEIVNALQFLINENILSIEK